MPRTNGSCQMLVNWHQGYLSCVDSWAYTVAGIVPLHETLMRTHVLPEVFAIQYLAVVMLGVIGTNKSYGWITFYYSLLVRNVHLLIDRRVNVMYEETTNGNVR